eukprot:TRINITY_DN4852_c0_g1_i1.p1 TRINITY_DN4852_c0_g1~~TRINITY_DN4852_c0_g1_i1.p1  ORF type:complete len:209 (-),score=51.83 TRINITY_DN4852_c0_g1_i1:94-720(-)
MKLAYVCVFLIVCSAILPVEMKGSYISSRRSRTTRYNDYYVNGAQNVTPQLGLALGLIGLVFFERRRKLDDKSNDKNVIKFTQNGDTSMMIEEPSKYFEIVCEEMDGVVSIGVAENIVENRLPGWDKTTIAYHSDDGKLYNQSEKGQDFGETFAKGDVVGCLLNAEESTIEFSLNGKLINSVEYHGDFNALRPAVGADQKSQLVLRTY